METELNAFEVKQYCDTCGESFTINKFRKIQHL